MVVPRCGRTGEVVEPMLTDQWFVDMRKPAPATHPFFPGKSIQDLCLAAVSDAGLPAGAPGTGENVRFVPSEWISTYYNWINNIQDWCISRQLWWGHQIPAWYDESGNVYVARDEAAARKAATAKLGREPKSFVRDDDVLDTWFSSALWCHSTLGWPANTPELSTFLPSSVLVTGFDIIFFWVARMIMTTTYFTGHVPFRDVYINAIVRDEEGQKMSKSKGNVLDPLDLIDGVDVETLVTKATSNMMDPRQAEKIAQRTRRNYPEGIPAFGADAVRFTFASLATFNRTLNFDLNRCEGYRNFCNKLWNATRFVLMNLEGKDCGQDDAQPKTLSFVDRWLLGRLQQAKHDIAAGIDQYRFDLAAKALYEFVWDEYLRLVRRARQGADGRCRHGRRRGRGARHALGAGARARGHAAPRASVRAVHHGGAVAVGGAPRGQARRLDLDCSRSRRRTSTRVDAAANAKMDTLKAIVNACRGLRGEMKVSPDKRPPLFVAGDAAVLAELTRYVKPLAKVSDVRVVDELPSSDAPVDIVGEFRLMLHIEVDPGRRARADRQGKIARTKARSARRAPSSATTRSSPARRPPWSSRSARGSRPSRPRWRSSTSNTSDSAADARSGATRRAGARAARGAEPVAVRRRGDGGRVHRPLVRLPGPARSLLSRRGPLRGDPARDARERRLRHAATQRLSLLREAAAAVLADGGGVRGRRRGRGRGAFHSRPRGARGRARRARHRAEDSRAGARAGWREP